MSGFCHSGCLELSWVEKLKAMRLLYEEKNNDYWRSEIAASKGDTRSDGRSRVSWARSYSRH